MIFSDDNRNNEAVKRNIRERCGGYIERAEHIKKYLDEKKSGSKPEKKKKAEGADK